jgi:hypothetical protein
MKRTKNLVEQETPQKFRFSKFLPWTGRKPEVKKEA